MSLFLGFIFLVILLGGEGGAGFWCIFLLLHYFVLFLSSCLVNLFCQLSLLFSCV